MSGRFPLVEVEAHAKVKWFPRVLREDAGQILALSRIRNLGQVELSTAVRVGSLSRAARPAA